MKTTIQEQENHILVTLVGELDTTAAMEMEETLAPLSGHNGRDVIIDCTHLDIASSGLRVLLSILKQGKAHGNKVVLKNVNNDIREVFRLTGFIDIFNFE